MIRVIKSLLRLVLYAPLRMLRFAAKLTVLGCLVWLGTTKLNDGPQWILAGIVAFICLWGIDFVLRWIGKPELL